VQQRSKFLNDVCGYVDTHEIHKLAGDKEASTRSVVDQTASRVLLRSERLVSRGSREAFGVASHDPFVEE
jgi:hypothetical protein